MICLMFLLNYRGLSNICREALLCKIQVPIEGNTEKQKYREGSKEREKATKTESEEESQ